MGNNNQDKRDVHWNLYDKDIRAFKIWMLKQGYTSIPEAFHELIEIKSNQPPGKMII